MDVFFIMTAYGENALWAAGEFLAEIQRIAATKKLEARLSTLTASSSNDTLMKVTHKP